VTTGSAFGSSITYWWSSYRVNAEGKASGLIEPHEQFLRPGRGAQARHEAYRALFQAARSG